MDSKYTFNELERILEKLLEDFGRAVYKMTDYRANLQRLGDYLRRLIVIPSTTLGSPLRSTSGTASIYNKALLSPIRV